jgi:hypothetical protein
MSGSILERSPTGSRNACRRVVTCPGRNVGHQNPRRCFAKEVRDTQSAPSMRIPAKADSDSDRLRTAFRSIADSVPVIADSGSRRRLQRFTGRCRCQAFHANRPCRDQLSSHPLVRSAPSFRPDPPRSVRHGLYPEGLLHSRGTRAGRTPRVWARQLFRRVIGPASPHGPPIADAAHSRQGTAAGVV